MPDKRKQEKTAPKKDPNANLSKEDLVKKLREAEEENRSLNSRMLKLEKIVDDFAKSPPAKQPRQQAALSPEVIQAIGIAVASAVDGIFEKFKSMMDARDDEKRRQKNVVVFRLLEYSSTSEEEIDSADRVTVEAVCRDMGIAPEKIKFAERLGSRKQKPPVRVNSDSMDTAQPSQPSRPRPLKIRFRDTATKATFLRQSRTVFQRHFASQFNSSKSQIPPPVCRPDLNKEDAEKDRMARKECYEKNRDSTDGNKWVVRKGRCVPLSEI